ncbi:NAD(P)H-binding protein [Rubrobacter marinus]|uniref:NAD(P)H-binding protein n=1 Tax=Rubrobacter marinus TaxID=2653852 RepID=A0A6G8Q2Z0_9ACTN|nr:NAD(P)H-binding protein [Rubrobacter marinus]QIN80842.1 NAD(P)H-binding protein [Rubrobacter marinus]
MTGATGAVGGRVAARLAEAGLAQRLVVRDPRRAPLLPKAEVAEASYADAAAMRRALEGVGAFFMVSGAEDRDRLGQHKAAVDAAVEAGVERIVYLSFVAAAPETTFTFGRDHYHTEVHIRASGLGFAFLRDNWYQDMLPLMAGPDGVIRGPAGVGRVGAVSRDDVADAAAAVLLGGAEHDGRTYDVTGPEAITLHEAAEELTRATGRPVTYHAETVEEAYSSRSGYGAPDWMVEGWVTSYAAMADGDLDVVSDAVRDLTGHAPATFAEFLSRHPESYRHLAEQG